MAKPADVKTVAIGLQGGGSHSAFAWGVLDELLEKVGQGQLRITAISGASGGALNGAVCAYGLRQNAKAAQDLLRKFWISVSEKSLWPENPFQSLFPENSPKRWNVDLNPLAIGFGMAEQITSPYMNPWGSDNILRPLLAEADPGFQRIRPTATPPGCTSARPPSIARRCASSGPRRLRSTRCWPRPACRRFSRRSRSTGRPIGMAAIWRTPR